MRLLAGARFGVRGRLQCRNGLGESGSKAEIDGIIVLYRCGSSAFRY